MLRDSYIGYMIRLTIKICVRYNGLIILYPCRRIRAITMDNQVIEKKKKIELLGFFSIDYRDENCVFLLVHHEYTRIAEADTYASLVKVLIL